MWQPYDDGLCCDTDGDAPLMNSWNDAFPSLLSFLVVNDELTSTSAEGLLLSQCLEEVLP